MSAIQWKPRFLNHCCQTCAQPDHVRGSTALMLTPYVWAKAPRHRVLVSTRDVVGCWHCCWHLSRRLLFLLLRSLQPKENCTPSYLPRSDATSVAPFCPIYFLSIGCHSNREHNCKESPWTRSFLFGDDSPWAEKYFKIQHTQLSAPL